MSDILDDGTEFLNTIANTIFGESVTYRRTGYDDETLTAIRSETQYEYVDENGVRVVTGATEWRILLADLEIDGSATQPQRLDRIIDADGDVYEYIDHALDSSKTEYRINTAQVGEVA